MNKQIIALIGVLVALAGGLSTGLVNCFNNQQATINSMSDAFIEQGKNHNEELSKLHTDYNAKMIDLIIKGN